MGNTPTTAPLHLTNAGVDGAWVGWVCPKRGRGHRHGGLGVSTCLHPLVARFSGMSAFTRASSGWNCEKTGDLSYVQTVPYYVNHVKQIHVFIANAGGRAECTNTLHPLADLDPGDSCARPNPQWARRTLGQPQVDHREAAGGSAKEGLRALSLLLYPPHSSSAPKQPPKDASAQFHHQQP